MIETEDLPDVKATLRALGSAGEPGVEERGSSLFMLVGRRGPITEERFEREREREAETTRTYRVEYEPLSPDLARHHPNSEFLVIRIAPFHPSWHLRTFPA